MNSHHPSRRRGRIAGLLATAALAAGTIAFAFATSPTDAAPKAGYDVQPASPAVGAASACTVDGPDGVALLMLIASMHDGAGTRLAASLSPQVQQLVGDAAFGAQYVDWGAATTPDPDTLAVAVAPMHEADRNVVLSSLAPELRADVESGLDAVVRYTDCPLRGRCGEASRLGVVRGQPLV